MRPLSICAAFALTLAILAACGVPAALGAWLFFPSQPFAADGVPAAPDYTQASSWSSSPLHADTTDRASWVPLSGGEADGQSGARADVFWVHPTTYFLGHWNAPVDNTPASTLATLATDIVVMREQAAVFNGECRVFAPRYRQLSQGAQDGFPPEEQQPAMDVAFSDVWAAFRHFVERTEGRPFFVGSYSQGTLHAMRLVKHWFRTAPAEETARLVAWYGIGNTVSEAEMAGTLPVCRHARQTRCFLSYNTVLYRDEGRRDHWKAKGHPTCVNPLSWRQDDELVGAELHLGAVPVLSSHGIVGRILVYPLTGQLTFDVHDKGLTTAQCKDGVLYVPDPAANESVGHKYWLKPGGGMHALDYNLFWFNLRANVRQRLDAFLVPPA